MKYIALSATAVILSVLGIYCFVSDCLEYVENVDILSALFPQEQIEQSQKVFTGLSEIHSEWEENELKSLWDDEE